MIPLLSEDTSLSVPLSNVLPFDSPDMIATETTPPPGPVDPPSIVQYPVLQHVPVGSSQTLALPPRAPLSSQNNGAVRSPLSTVNQNIQTTHRCGPTDKQLRKVEAIVLMGAQIITTAMACVDVLFTEAELALLVPEDTSSWMTLSSGSLHQRPARSLIHQCLTTNGRTCASASIRNVEVGSSQTLALPPRAPLSSQNNGAVRSPLSTVNQNIQTTHRCGPTDKQPRKVEAIVLMGAQIITTAMACVDVLFTEAELANGNTSGSRGYQQLDDLKLRLLASTPCQKFDSPVFNDQWENMRERINTKC